MDINLIGRKNEYSFEKKLILITCLILSICALTVAYIKLILGFDWKVILALFLIFNCFVILYILGRFTNRDLLLRWLISILSLVFVNLLWYFNFGSNGPANFLFFIYYAFIIYIWKKKYLLYFSIVLFLNLTALFFLNLLYPDAVSDYTEKTTKTIDIYTSLIVCLFIIFVYTIYAKQNYIAQYIEAKKFDKYKSAFLRNISHEIRTPLNAIVGFSQLFVRQELSDETKHVYSKIININSKYLSNLIGDILIMSEIESGQFSMISSECKIKELFYGLKDEFEKELDTLNKAQIKLDYKIYNDLETIYSDKTRLKQILKSLIGNSIKFTNEGTVEFGCFKLKHSIVFYVQDTGRGIKKENVDKIFDSFVKIDIKDNKFYSGVGIGLFLAKELVRLLNGKIWVETKVGEGSTFYFSIPETKNT